jgi:hypothetical protein
MRHTKQIAMLVVTGLIAGAAVRSAVAQEKAQHTIVNASDVKFTPGPAGLPAGAEFMVLEGDPSKAGVPFSIRAKMPDGYRVPPHWHPTDENIVVLSGAVLFGMGDKTDMKPHAVPAGGFVKMPARMVHSATARGETIIHVYGVGPFDITYVNPADDPRKKTTTQ